jgi:hypothetical protein
MTTTRTATEGTQKHTDLATEKMNIKFYVDVHGMTRAAAKKKVDGMVQRGEKLLSAAQINRAIAAHKKAERAAEARKAKEAEAAKKAEEAKAAEEAKKAEEAAKKAEAEAAKKAKAEAAKKKWESDAKKAEPKTEKTGKTIKQGKVGVTVNGVQYASICAGMKAVGIPDKGTNNWSRIRSALKKTGQIDFIIGGSTYQFIQL